MRKALLIVSGLVVGGIVGCAAPAHQTQDQLNTRYQSASMISNAGDKDVEMSKIANDAADSMLPDTCLNAVNDIQDRDKRDRTAHDCADKFDKNGSGDRATAEKLANKITDPNLKDQVLKYYAEHPPKSAM